MNTNMMLTVLSHKMEYVIHFPILGRGSTTPEHISLQTAYYRLILEFLNQDLAVLLPKLRQFDIYDASVGCSKALFYLLKTDTMAIRRNSTNSLIQLQQSYLNALTQWDFSYLAENPYPKGLSYHMEFEVDTGLLIPIYELKGSSDFFTFELMHLMQQKEQPKTCHNCNRLFLPSNRSDEKYCDHAGPDGKTCKQIGYANTIRKDNPFQYEYRKAYKTQYARIRYFTHIENYKERYFDQWHKAAKEAKSLFEAAHDLDGFKVWLRNSQNSYKPEKRKKEYSA